MWVLFGILSAISAALVAIFGKIGIQNVDTTLATTIRASVMALFLLGVSLILGKYTELGAFHGKVMWYIVASGIAGALSWLFYFFALKTGPASGVVALDRLSVIFVLILAILFLGEHLTWKSGIGAGLIAFGAILMTLK